MLTDGAERWDATVRSISRWLAFVAVTIALLAVIGHLTGDVVLTSGVEGLEPMSPLSALAQVLLGIVLITDRAGRIGDMLLLTVAGVLAAFAVGSNLTYGEDHMRLLAARVLSGSRTWSEPMSTGSGIAVLLLACALFPTPPTWRLTLARNAAAGCAFLIGLTLVLAYAYGPAELGPLMPFRSMSLNSAVSVMTLAVATILAEPGQGWARVIAGPERSGKMTRLQLLSAFGPAAIGLLLIRAHQHSLLTIAAAMALLVAFTVVPLLWLVLREGRTLRELDVERSNRLRLVERHSAELQRRLDAQAEALRDSNAKLLAIAEAASTRSKIRYRQLFDSIDSGFCVIEMKFAPDGAPVDYRFVEVNPAFERQTGLSDVEGKWMRDLVPENEQQWFDVYGRVARIGEPIRFEHQARELGDRWYDVSAFRIEAAENLVGVLFQDISARRAIELQLKAMNETLEQRVEAAVNEREEAQEALRHAQKMEAIGQLTGGVAHDFNNLLTPILGSLDLLTRRGGLGEREQRLVAAALQSAERAKTLVQRLLAIARRQPLQPGPVDLGALVTGMAELVVSTSGPHIRVDVDIAPDLPPAIGDANQLEMAILNLCVNARDAMPEGGRLTLAVRPGTRRPPTQPPLPEGSYLRLSVTDDGTGMDSQTAARAIEPFFSTKGIGKGTGLGLSMVHGLAMQLGGALSIASSIGRGTRVDLYLRAGDAPIPAVPAADVLPHPESAPLSGHALVVDDQDQVRSMTAHLLQELGFTTEECDSATAAECRLHAGEPFDLIVTDHLMPGLSGAGLAARLARERPEIAVLIVSGYADPELLGPELHFLRKPFRKAELASAVARAFAPKCGVSKPVGAAADTL